MRNQHRFMYTISLSRLICTVVLFSFFTKTFSQTYTFTPAGATGRFGPTQTQINNAYSTTNLNGYVTTTLGIQYFTVPASGFYQVTAKGAKGGNGQSGIGGPGAVMSGEFYLTAGQALKICVGQMGLAGHQGGGGGGSFVTGINDTPLIIAGGGGGAFNANTSTFSIINMQGSSGTSGMSGVNDNLLVLAGSGGTAGNGGLTSAVAGDGSGGGGLLTNGEDGNPSMGGLAFVNGAIGGAGATTTNGIGGDGGFGGGGGGDWTLWTGSGGGGGYSGGGGGVHFGFGGGGGSYNSGTNQLNASGTNSAVGSIIFTKIAGVNIIQTASISCYGQLTAAITGSPFGGLGPYTYTWLPTNTHAYNETGIGAGTYTCITQDANGTIFTNSFVVKQPAQLVAAVTKTNISCFGLVDGQIKITPSGGTGPYSYSWLPANPGTSTLSGLSQGNYTNTLSDANGCSTTTIASITEPPVFTVSASASQPTVCSGQSVILSGSTAQSYTWSDGVINAVAFIPSVTKIYSLTATNASGCVATATSEIVVSPVPTLAIAGSNSLCAGSGISFTLSGADSYSWNASATSSVFTEVPAASQVYTLTGVMNGCASSLTKSLTVFQNTISAHATSTSVCSGNTVTLYGSGADAYTWSNGVTDNVAFTPAATAVYTVTASNPCYTPTQTIEIVVHNLPAVTAHVTQSVVCLNKTSTLYGSGATSYTWSGGVIDNTAFTPLVTTDYTLTGTDLHGCQNTAITTISVNALPVLTISASSTQVCSGNSLSLSGSGAITYTWSDNVVNNVSFIPSASHTYTLTGTDANGCENTAAQSITVNPLPVVLANTSSSVICSGNSVTLTGTGADTYTWTGGVIDGVSFSPVTSAVYTVTGTNILTGCTNMASQLIIVNPLPGLSISVSGSVVCSGNSVTINASGADVYTWSNGILNNVPFYPITSNNYSVTGTNILTGCSNTLSQLIQVNPLPVITTSASGNAVCLGNTVILTASGANTYAWSGNVINGTPFSPLATAAYSVTGTNTLTGCTSTNSAIQTVTVHPLPVLNITASATLICLGETADLTVTGAQTYSWNISETTSSIHVSPSSTAHYTVTGMDGNGCVNTTSATVEVSECLGLDSQPDQAAPINLFPNPNNGEFFISAEQEMNLEIINDLGQLVKRITLNGNTGQNYFVTDLPNGIYFIIGQKGKQFVKLKMIVER